MTENNFPYLSILENNSIEFRDLQSKFRLFLAKDFNNGKFTYLIKFYLWTILLNKLNRLQKIISRS